MDEDKKKDSGVRVSSDDEPNDPDGFEDGKEVDVNKLLDRVDRLEERIKVLEKDEAKELPMETITAIPLDGAIKALSSLALSPSSQASFKKMCPYLFEE